MVIMTKERIENGPPVIPFTPDGKLTRTGALIEARKLYGDLGTISSDEQLPRLIWCIGQMNRTLGKGKSWEQALEQAKRRATKIDLARLRRETPDIDTDHNGGNR